MRSLVHNHIGDWLKLRLDEIDRRMVVSRHATLADRPSLANHLFRAFRTIWNHARRTCQLPESPTVAIEWHDEEVHAPIIEDLREWRRQVDALENPIHAALYRFILFTGFRKTEALTLRWRDVHPDHNPEPPRRLAPAHAIVQHRNAELRIQFHAMHPSAPGPTIAIQELATGGILHRPSPDHPGGSVAGYEGALLNRWRSHYNTERPHSALGYLSPKEFLNTIAAPALETLAVSAPALDTQSPTENSRAPWP